MEKLGLSSLTERIHKLESQKKVAKSEEEEEEDLFSVLYQKQKELKKKQLRDLNETYLKALFDTLDQVNETKLVAVILFTNNYVERNIDAIAKLVQTKKSEEMEILIVCDFITRIFGDHFKNTLIEESVRALRGCQIIHTSINVEKMCEKTKVEETKQHRKKIKFFGK
jgi:hypothetical protein